MPLVREILQDGSGCGDRNAKPLSVRSDPHGSYIGAFEDGGGAITESIDG